LEKFEKLKTQLPGLRDKLANIRLTKLEIISLKIKVSQENKKLCMLNALANRSLNIHRWRFLLASDPKLASTLKRVRDLQKTNIEQHQQLKIVDEDIKEKEAEIAAIQSEAKTWKSPAQLQEQLQELQLGLKENEAKANQAETEALAEIQYLNDLKYERARLGRELDSLMQQYFLIKRR